MIDDYTAANDPHVSNSAWVLQVMFYCELPFTTQIGRAYILA